MSHESYRPREAARLCLRCVLEWPLFGMALIPLAGAPATAQNAILPFGGVVTAGQAAVGNPDGGALTVTQSSAKAIIDWHGFSIGEGGKVRFDNGTGATLNRVKGGSASALDGLLSASGSVYLLNPNGVIVGVTGVVDVGGSFVASTLDVSDAAFLAGGELPFAGPSRAAIVNLGRIGALGGDVALIATAVRNDGSLTAANGTVGLIAGSQLLLRDAALDGGRFTVEVGGTGTSATNAGAIAAAAVELRANGGNVYALAGNDGGTVRASGVSSRGGRIYLTAGGGKVVAEGEIDARGPGGASGFVETSGANVDFAAARIDAGAGGIWLLDPTDLRIDQAAANAISNTLQGGTNVTQATSSLGSGGNGDIFVDPNVTVSWGVASSLTLSAYRNVAIGAGASIASSGGGAITLKADNDGRGIGTVSFGAGARASSTGPIAIFYNPASYASPTSYSPFVTGPLSAYMLVNNAADLQRVGTNLGGTYALSHDLDASGLTNFTSIGSVADKGFTGIFDGQKYVINGLVLDRPGSDDVGLFGLIATAGTVRNLGLLGGRASGANYVGMLAARNLGTITASFSNGPVTATGDFAGGITGVSYGPLTDVHATGAVAGVNNVGGLVGYNASNIRSSDASGAVTGNDVVGGLTGFNGGTITLSSSTGRTAGRDAVGALTGFNDAGSRIDNAATYGETLGRNYVGGFAGYNSGTLDSVNASGPVNATGNQVGGLAGLSSGKIALSYAAGAITGQAFVGGLAGTNSGNIYAGNGYGTVAGATYVGGLVGKNDERARIEGGFARGDVTASAEHAGGLVGMNAGVVINGSALGNVQGTFFTGGLAGWNTGSVGTGYFDYYLNGANGNVSGLDLVGGLVGLNDVTGTIISGISNNMVMGRNYVGGVVGYNSNEVQHVSATGKVVASGNQVGGAAGVNGGSIDDAFIKASVTGSLFVGGIAGTNGGSGSITGSTSIGAIGGEAYVGGLAGKNEGAITRSRTESAVTASDYSVGGIVGSNDAGSLQQVYTTGPVKGRSYVGGVAGYNGALISDSYSTSTVTGDTLVGGLAGANAGMGSISTSYASGMLSFGGLGGGIAGYNAARLLDVYWDVATSGAAIGIGSDVGSSSGVTAIGGSTGRDPRQQVTYRFDFINVWQIGTGTRPYLRRFAQNPPPQ